MKDNELRTDWQETGKQELFREAAIAATKQDYPGLSKAYQKLTSFHAMLNQLQAMESNSGSPASVQLPRAPSSEPPRPGESDKQRGERVRTDWVSRNLGSTVTPLRGALYRKLDGDTVGIAYGEEKRGREGRWFLGLPAGKSHSVILLCQPLSGSLFAIGLPAEFMTKHNPQLSKSKVGQVKFSVFRRGDNYSLQVPHTGRVPITEYLNKIP